VGLHRAIADSQLRWERAAADGSLRRQRASEADARAAPVPVEREQTDRDLLLERRISDDKLGYRDVTASTERFPNVPSNARDPYTPPPLR
jgi:hypothetical protein